MPDTTQLSVDITAPFPCVHCGMNFLFGDRQLRRCDGCTCQIEEHAEPLVAPPSPRSRPRRRRPLTGRPL